jgi:hypothetical protein
MRSVVLVLTGAEFCMERPGPSVARGGADVGEKPLILFFHPSIVLSFEK